MSVSRPNARRLFGLSILVLGLLMTGNACVNDPNKESSTEECVYNEITNECE
jgi:hypothetical protein